LTDTEIIFRYESWSRFAGKSYSPDYWSWSNHLMWRYCWLFMLL